jgi:hypothetical protein
LQGRADHAPGKLAHGRKIHRQIDRLELQHLLGAAHNAHRLVADPLQVAVDLDDRQDEAQIDGHGLLLGQQLIGHLIQLALRGVDGPLILLDVLAQALVALQVGVHRGLDRLSARGPPWPAACP